jgi:hypothetical protein
MEVSFWFGENKKSFPLYNKYPFPGSVNTANTLLFVGVNF